MYGAAGSSRNIFRRVGAGMLIAAALAFGPFGQSLVARADEPSCTALDRRIVARMKAISDGPTIAAPTQMALNRAHLRLNGARIDCKHGRIERAEIRYRQALDELSALPPAVTEATADLGDLD